MNAIIIDDEPLALRSMERLLGNAGIQVVGSFSDPLEAVEHGLKNQPDLAFLDIEMPEMNGLETAERLLSMQPNLQIVFVTAFHDYAIEAFELNALDYLMKPVQPARLNKTLQRISLPGKSELVQEQQITLRLFKYLHIHHSAQGALPIHWRTSKAQELFAYLVHYRQRAAIRKDELIDLLWADHDQQKASALLHTTIYQVRRTIKQIDPSMQIQFIDGGFRLLLGNVKLDVDEWEQSLDSLPPLSADTIEQHEQLLSLYTGNYLEDHHFIWAEKESERLKLVWLDQIKPTIAYYIEHENYAKALHGLQLVQETLPYSQDGYLGLMQLNARLGHYEEVRKLFKQYTLLLHEDLGIEPEERISQWYMDWLQSKKLIQL